MDTFEPRVTYYEDIGAIRVQLRDLRYWRGRSVDLLRAVDYSEDGQVIDVVFRDVRKRGIDLDGIPEAESIAEVLRDQGYGEYLEQARRRQQELHGDDADGLEADN